MIQVSLVNTLLILKSISVLILIVAGQFVKHKLPDLLRSYIDAGKSSVTF